MHPAALQSPAIHFPVDFHMVMRTTVLMSVVFFLLLVNPPGNRLENRVYMFIGG